MKKTSKGKQRASPVRRKGCFREASWEASRIHQREEQNHRGAVGRCQAMRKTPEKVSFFV